MIQQNYINISSFINNHKISAYQWMIFSVCFTITLLDGFDTGAIGYIAPSLVAEWGIARPALGPVLSAALFGLAIGALISGPIADSLGRRIPLAVSVLWFGLACLASSYSQNLEQLTYLRFLTGIGLGAAMANAVTITSEFCPESRRSLLTNAIFCGFPLGAALGGFLSAWIVPAFGWRTLLALGGIAPLALAVLIFLVVPESLKYMVTKGYDPKRIKAVLSRISADATAAVHFETAVIRPSAAARGAALVISSSYIMGTVTLWIAYFMGLVIFYALISWMPLLFKDVGVDPSTATLIAALFPLGGFGAIFSGFLMDRFNANRIIAICYALAALCVYVIGLTAGYNRAVLVAAVFLAGIFVNTAQVSMPSLAAAFYPTEGRATGVAWMLGIGRFGGIAGSLLVAELTRNNLDFRTIFAIVAIPGVICAAALFIKQFLYPRTGLAGARDQEAPLAH